MSENKSFDLYLIIKTVVVFLVSSILAVLLFAVGMYFLEKGYEYSPLFATVSMAVGCFASAFYLGLKRKRQGILIGIAVSGISFILITLITLLINSGAVGTHIFLRLIIFVLSGLIGAVLGVNRNQNPKYI